VIDAGNAKKGKNLERERSILTNCLKSSTPIKIYTRDANNLRVTLWNLISNMKGRWVQVIFLKKKRIVANDVSRILSKQKNAELVMERIKPYRV